LSLSKPPGLRPGAIPSPNIWYDPATYELENRAVDPDGVIEATMRSIRPYADSVVVDVGCGTGFHLPRFAETAAEVIGVEPHPTLALAARRRTKSLPNVRVLHASAQATTLAPASVDVVHARWAYFFGPGCEPGLAEIDRVLRRGGAAFLIDNDARTSAFGRWFSWEHPDYDTDAVDAFFAARGWANQPVSMRWSFATRADLEAVVRIEFSPAVAERIIAEHEGIDVDYAIVIRHLTR
jgi:SAM-dependent methyltransferase